MLKILSLNKKNKFTFEPKDNMEYIDLKSMYEKCGTEYISVLRGVFTKDSKFGKQSVAITDDFYINLPAHVNEIVDEILQDDEIIDEINKGQVGFKIYQYYSKKYDKKCYSIEFVEI